MTRKIFTASGTFVVPAGIKRVTVYGMRNPGRVYSTGLNGLGIDEIGELWAWGTGANGAMGDGTTTAKSSPVKVAGGLRWLYAAGGSVNDNSRAVGITANGLAYSWGATNNGVLGTGVNASSSSPVLLAGNLKFKKIVVGDDSSMHAITPAGAGYAWGFNSQGELGQNNVTSKSSPVAMVGSVVFKDIAADYRCTAGLSSIGEVYVWGRNDEGQLGQGNNGPGTEKSSPVKVSGLSSGFQKIVAGALGWVALDANGRCWGWGSNANGEIGDGTAGFGNDKASPVSTVQGSLVFTELYSTKDASLGGATLIAKATNGNYYGWGANSSGQMGSGNTSARSSPVQVLTGHDFLWLNAQQNGFNGIKKDGTIWAWGANGSGQLGDSTNVSKSTPTQLTNHPVYRSRIEVTEQVISVTPGASVTVTIADLMMQFGSTPIQAFGDTLVVEW